MAGKVSFAPMAEDIVLWRALGSRPPGFYVDVGAHHPIGSSVTKIFYNEGWSGINIEPITLLLDLFDDDRPRDINLAIGISDQHGEMEFFEVDSDQQRSTFDPGLAEIYRNEGRKVTAKRVPVVPLNEVLEQHAGDREIDFLKIDAEGHEASVIRSIDLSRWRPHVIVGEASPFIPNPWTTTITDAGYRPALFDGINRYFVSDEHWDELGVALSYPACPNDNYDSFDHLLEVNELKRELAEVRAELAALQATHASD